MTRIFDALKHYFTEYPDHEMNFENPVSRMVDEQRGLYYVKSI